MERVQLAWPTWLSAKSCLMDMTTAPCPVAMPVFWSATCRASATFQQATCRASTTCRLRNSKCRKYRSMSEPSVYWTWHFTPPRAPLSAFSILNMSCWYHFLCYTLWCASTTTQAAVREHVSCPDLSTCISAKSCLLDMTLHPSPGCTASLLVLNTSCNTMVKISKIPIANIAEFTYVQYISRKLGRLFISNTWCIKHNISCISSTLLLPRN